MDQFRNADCGISGDRYLGKLGVMKVSIPFVRFTVGL